MTALIERLRGPIARKGPRGLLHELLSEVSEVQRDLDRVAIEQERAEAAAALAKQQEEIERLRKPVVDEALLSALTTTITDEVGSRLCEWVDLGTKRTCGINTTTGTCLCQQTARAVLTVVSARIRAAGEAGQRRMQERAKDECEHVRSENACTRSAGSERDRHLALGRIDGALICMSNIAALPIEGMNDGN